MADELHLVVMTDIFPELSETFVLTEARELQQAGHRLRIEAGTRSPIPNPDGAGGLAVSYLEDDTLAFKIRSALWLMARHPLRCLRDLLAGLRWRKEEQVRSLPALAAVARRLVRGREKLIHVHFAGTAALDALRLSRLLGVPYSLTAHAYDIYKHPRNLREKLHHAAVVTTGCRYNVDYLARLTDPEPGPQIHEIVMGVDADRFRRRTPYPDARTVLAIGRLIEKKGFAHLVEAVGLLEPDGVLERVTIVGEGPLHDALRTRARELGVADRVELPGARGPDDVRELLESSAVLVMPCVVAADGDRDSMPVVVKEALAMQVPVVASDEVGLPEVVRPEWGRLVPPGDPRALAEAIRELLALPRDTRAVMGRAGREFVVEHCSAERETGKLVELLAAASA